MLVKIWRTQQNNFSSVSLIKQLELVNETTSQSDDQSVDQGDDQGDYQSNDQSDEYTLFC